LFDRLLSNWNHKGPLIINLKTEGIEEKCIKLLNQYKIERWFFLDMSMPFFVKYANLAFEKKIPGFNTDNLAVRFSEYEAEEYAMGFTNKAGWVWVDCFNELPIDRVKIQKFQNAGFKVCIVSPELQRHNLKMIEEIIEKTGNRFDAVCTKHPEIWAKAMHLSN
jgi:hypothetical protein